MSRKVKKKEGGTSRHGKGQVRKSTGRLLVGFAKQQQKQKQKQKEKEEQEQEQRPKKEQWTQKKTFPQQRPKGKSKSKGKGKLRRLWSFESGFDVLLDDWRGVAGLEWSKESEHHMNKR